MRKGRMIATMGLTLAFGVAPAMALMQTVHVANDPGHLDDLINNSAWQVHELGVNFPANEIVIPTIIMGYMNLNRMTELADPGQLFVGEGWTLVTACCVMLFSLLHYPCTTTTLTIWSETRDWKWTLLSNAIPLGVAIMVCFTVAQVTRSLGW